MGKISPAAHNQIRAKFWTFYQGLYEFRHLAIHEDELIRLWVYLGLKPLHVHHRGSIFDSTRSSLGAGIKNDLDLGLHMGWRSQEVHQRFTIVCLNAVFFCKFKWFSLINLTTVFLVFLHRFKGN
jgi:hypothetical protein